MTQTRVDPRKAFSDIGKMRKIAVASVIGTTVEWYDLFLFATASALVFNKIFFPSFDPLVGTMLAFGTFAAAYCGAHRRRRTLRPLRRPAGPQVDAARLAADDGRRHVRDRPAAGLRHDRRLGRPPAADAPSHPGPRALGGEWGGAVLMAVEHAPRTARLLRLARAGRGPRSGRLIANLAFLVVAAVMPGQALVAWGWRIPSWPASVLVAVGLYIRLTLEETPFLPSGPRRRRQGQDPVRRALREHWKEVLLGAVATVSTGTTFSIIIAIGLAYGKKELGIFRPTTMLWAVHRRVALGLRDHPGLRPPERPFGRKPIIVAGIVRGDRLCVPNVLADGYEVRRAASSSPTWPDDDRFLCQLRPAGHVPRGAVRFRVRYSGLSLAYMLAGLLGSAITPVVTTALLKATGQGSSVAWFLIGSAVVSLVGLLLLSETLRSNLDSVHEAPVRASSTPTPKKYRWVHEAPSYRPRRRRAQGRRLPGRRSQRVRTYAS